MRYRTLTGFETEMSIAIVAMILMLAATLLSLNNRFVTEQPQHRPAVQQMADSTRQPVSMIASN